MEFRLSKRSVENLSGVHSDLVRVVNKAIKITSTDFAVLEGLRTLDRQRQLFEAGATRTMNSKHLTGNAVDLGAYVNGQIRWDWPLYYRIADAIFDSADQEGVKIVWGGNWEQFPDGPHFELVP